MTISFEPHLVETVVRREVDAGRRGAGTEYHRLFDALVAAGVHRDEGRLASLHKYLFLSLGLDQPFVSVQREFPAVDLPVRVSAPEELEGCFLPDSRTAMLVKLFPERFDDLLQLTLRLRHEWSHVADMLLPEFAYPKLPPPLDTVACDRLSVLWGAHTDARTERRGQAPLRSHQVWGEHVMRFWSGVDLPIRSAAFEGFCAGAFYSHAELVDFAADPRLLLTRFAKVPVRGYPGGRCPLCQFSTFHWTFPSREQDRVLADRVHEDFPAWSAEDGLCERCVELYEFKSGHW